MVSDVGGKSAAGQADSYSEGGNGWEETPIQSDPLRGKSQEPPNRKWSLGFWGLWICLEDLGLGVRKGKKKKVKEGALLGPCFLLLFYCTRLGGAEIVR